MHHVASSHFAAVGGLRIHYRSWGNRRALPLLLLHDLGETADQWLPLAAVLGAEFRVVAPDLRGHGESDWIDTYSPQEIGDDAGELAGVLGLIPAAVAGIGLGGLAAALLAARQGYLVERLCLLGAGVHANLPPERAAEQALYAELPPDAPSPQAWVTAWHNARVRAGLRHDATAATHADPWRMVRRLTSGRVAPAWDRAGYQLYRAWSPGAHAVSYAEEFHEIDVPVTLIYGAHDPVLPGEAVAATTATIKDCRAVRIAGARHDLLHDRPAAVAAAMLPFLRNAH